MPHGISLVNNVHIWHETFGQKEHPAVLLIMGNSAQGMMWPEKFCRKLAAANRYIIRFDHRDTGLSSCIDFEKNPYDLFALAQDALGLLDILGVKKAHIVGLSMGGSIAQLLAIYYKERILSITSMMSSPDLSVKNDAFSGKDTTHATLPPPKKEFVEAVIALNKIAPKTKQDKITQIVENWRLANGEKASFNENYWHQLVEETIEREESRPDAIKIKFANHGNHSKAQMASSEPNLKTLKLISVPTLVIHGSEDPIFPPLHAQSVVDCVPNSKLLLIDGMGHALNSAYFETIILEIIKHTTE